MALESAQHIDELVTANPVGSTDALSTADDHIRMIKDVLKRDFPDVDQAVSTIISSTTEPTLNRKGTLWLDETNDLAKLRNKGDTAWITLPISVTASNTVDINGGTMDGVAINASPIGATTPSTIAGTTIHATGAVTGDSTFDGRDLAVDGTKLDGIETGATADQTGAQIKVAYEAEADTNAFDDAASTRLADLSYLLLATQTASASANLEFDSGLNFSTYSSYVFILTDIVGATDNVTLQIRFSTDGGSTYISTTTYGLAYNTVNTAGNAVRANASVDAIEVGATALLDWGNAAGESFGGEVRLMNPSNASTTPKVAFNITGDASDGTISTAAGSGKNQNAIDVDGVQFAMRSGNITSGTIKLYGIS